jgi:excisionase family DNA binding protein
MSSQLITHADVVIPNQVTQQAAAQMTSALQEIQPHLPTARLALTDGQEFDIPEELVTLLVTALRIAAEGDSINLSVLHEEMTTSEASRLLGVSRPTVVKLLDDGLIAFRMVGSHRRVLRKSAIAYSEEVLKRRRHQALLIMAETEALGIED